MPRDTEFHIKLRREFRRRNARIECLNFKFDDTPEGEFIETILAAQGQLEREQNGRQVKQKMKARLAAGYWCFHAPVGYKYAKTKEHGKLIVPDENLAPVIVEAFEGYASGRFGSQAEVKRFFASSPHFPKPREGAVTQQRVTDILTNPLYAGVINKNDWGLSSVQGKHDPLVSPLLFRNVQDRTYG